MTATVVAEPTKLFSQEVIVANEYRLRLERTATEEAESITGTVPPSWDFGDWRVDEPGHENSRPSCAEVEQACSKAIGFAVEIDTMDTVAPQDRPKESEITIHFARKREPDGTPAAPPEEDERDKEVRLKDQRDKKIRAAAAHVKKLRQLAKRCKAEAKTAKKDWEAADAAVKEAQEVLENIIDGKDRSLFPPPPVDDHQPGKNGWHQPAPSSVGAEPRDNPDPIEVLKEFGLTDAIIEKLKKADIHTIGQLVRFQEQKGLEGHSAPLTTIKGIKGATLEKLDNACAAYWAARGKTVEAG